MVNGPTESVFGIGHDIHVASAERQEGEAENSLKASGCVQVSVAETRTEAVAKLVAKFLGNTHRASGLDLQNGIGERKIVLQYFSAAEHRRQAASALTARWRETTRLLAAVAGARIEERIRYLLYTPTHRLKSVYNFYGTSVDLNGTIFLDRKREKIMTLNDDPLEGRAEELHDHMAILARWTHMQGWLSQEQASVSASELMAQVQTTTLVPYFQVVAGRRPTDYEISRFWHLVDLEYLEYFFYFLQIHDGRALYRMTLALQKIETIIASLDQRAPNPNLTMQSESRVACMRASRAEVCTHTAMISPANSWWFFSLP